MPELTGSGAFLPYHDRAGENPGLKWDRGNVQVRTLEVAMERQVKTSVGATRGALRTDGAEHCLDSRRGRSPAGPGRRPVFLDDGPPASDRLHPKNHLLDPPLSLEPSACGLDPY